MFPGPVALVAGPGSGKTTRLARRIKCLVEERGADPDEIAVITFTVEAARNMKERITPPAKEGMPDVTLPTDRHPALICTMHSLGDRIVRENADRLAIRPNYRLLTSPKLRRAIFEDAARLCGEPAEFGRDCDETKAQAGGPSDDRQGAVFGVYNQILNACNAIDYDDQIIMACKLLSDCDDLRESWQRKACHLLVDEYQDINRAQLELIQRLAGRNPSGLFVVGDDDQSIYAFRGGEPGYIRDFTTHFGETARVIAIPDCFRCQPHVIGAAHGFIEIFNPDRIPKPPPECVRSEGPLVKVHNVPSGQREAEIIVNIIDEALSEGDVLVLVPKLEHAEPLKVALRNRRIAFEAQRPRASRATEVFVALKNWLDNYDDNLALRDLLAAIAEGDALGIPGPQSRR